jgi:putative transposase
LVFTPKYRRGPFTSAILDRCEQIMAEVCADSGAELRQFNGETVHVRYPPKGALSRLVNTLKGVSARRLRQELPGHIRKYLCGEHFWSPSYFAGSCAGAPLSIVKDYIGNQKRPTDTGADASPRHRQQGCDSSRPSTTGIPRNDQLNSSP